MLTSDQFKAIDVHLRRENWLLDEELVAELTDHYAAGIDERMARGASFADALQAIHTEFGGRKGLLNMEEEAQTQQSVRHIRLEWQLIRSFTQGPRWYIGAGLFATMLLVNTYSGQYERLSVANLIGFFFVLSAVVGNNLVSIFMHSRLRFSNTQFTNHYTAPAFSTAYLLCFTALIVKQYGGSFWGFPSADSETMIVVTVLETLCLIYYFVAVVRLSKFVTNKRRVSANTV